VQTDGGREENLGAPRAHDDCKENRRTGSASIRRKLRTDLGGILFDLGGVSHVVASKKTNVARPYISDRLDKERNLTGNEKKGRNAGRSQG